MTAKRGRRPLPAEEKLQELRVYVAPAVVAFYVRLGRGDAKAGIEALAKNSPMQVDACTGQRDGSTVDDPATV